jgi:hypothetical protein
MSSKGCLAVLVSLLVLVACSSPESSLERAKRSRDASDFQYVIDRYPESPQAQMASGYLDQLPAWNTAVNSKVVAPYDALLKDWPSGLFAADAKLRIAEISSWQDVQRAATVDLLKKHLDEFPDGLFERDGHARIEALKAMALRFDAIPNDADVKTLKSAAAEMAGSGYAKELWLRVERVVGLEAGKSLSVDEQFSGLGNVWDDLDQHIAEAGDDDYNRLRQARERIEMAKVDATSGGARFVLPGIVVHGLSDPSHFAIADSIVTEDGQATLYFSGTVKKGPPDEEICFSTEGSVNAAYSYTEFEDDLVPIMDFGFNFSFESGEKSFTHGTGQVVLNRLDPIHCSAGTIWRVYGDVGIVPDHVISADRKEGMAFYLVEGVGAVYLAGSGEVSTSDGELIFTAGSAN